MSTTTTENVFLTMLKKKWKKTFLDLFQNLWPLSQNIVPTSVAEMRQVVVRNLSGWLRFTILFLHNHIAADL